MPDIIDLLARSIALEIHDYTSGRQKWGDIDRIVQRLRLSNTAEIEEAIRLAHAKGWVVCDGEHGLRLTDAGSREVTSI